MALSPVCTVKDASGPYVSTTDGVDVTPGDTISVKLVDPLPVASWYLEVTGTDEFSSAPTLTGVNPVSHLVTTPSTVVTFSYLGFKGRALVFKSTVTGVGGPLETTFGIFSLTDLGRRVGATGETREGNSASGWAVKTNPLLREVPHEEPITTESIVGVDQALANHLSQHPLNSAALELYLNGILQEQGAGKDYTISGTTITWLAGSGTAVSMELTDRLVAVYQGQE